MIQRGLQTTYADTFGDEGVIRGRRQRKTKHDNEGKRNEIIDIIVKSCYEVKDKARFQLLLTGPDNLNIPA